MEFDQYSPQPQPGPEPPSGRTLWPYAVALLVIVLGVVGYLVWSGGETPPPPSVPTPPPATDEPTAEPHEPQLEAPGLAESDDWLRRVVGRVSGHPDLARWLVSDHLVRRFTAAVDNVARGESPRAHLGFLAPAERFAVVERGGSVFVDPRSFERYDRLAEVVDSIDGAGVVELYRQLEPLLQEGYADLGYPDRRFDDAFAAAVRHLLATPMPDDLAPLAPGVESYTFRDARLESLSPAQKHLLRTGPDNAAVILDKLREIAALLGI